MVRVKVLLAGRHERTPEGLCACSTVTLLRTADGVRLLVDTGSFGDGERLIEALAAEGLSPLDIQWVITTHLHLDHVANVNLFKNAAIVSKHGPHVPGIVMHGNSNVVSRVNVDQWELVPGVTTILTPGHVEAHLSVVAATEEGTVVICGDAIQKPEQIEERVLPEKVWNMDAFVQSRNKILDIADAVIPGHGGMIRIKEKHAA